MELLVGGFLASVLVLFQWSSFLDLVCLIRHCVGILPPICLVLISQSALSDVLTLASLVQDHLEWVVEVLWQPVMADDCLLLYLPC